MDSKKYLDWLASTCHDILGKNLSGLYVFGSKGLAEFIPGKSDFDILGIVDSEITDDQKTTLASVVDCQNTPIPASGIELLLVTKETASNPPEVPPYQFSIATGKTWGTHVDTSGGTKELFICLEISRTGGYILFGPSPAELISSVPRERILEAIIDGMRWHESKVLHPRDDPGAEHSVLNASRALQFIEEGIFQAKHEGGEWLLAREPDNKAVQQALNLRSGKTNEPVEEMQARALLSRVINLAEEELKL